MRILFTSTRGAGHLNPLFPYAEILKERGHNVRIATRQEQRARIERQGFEHVLFDEPDVKAMEAVWARAAEFEGDAKIGVYISDIFCGLLTQAALPGLQKAIQDWRPSLIVRESVEFSGIVAAMVNGISHCRVEVHNRVVEERVVLTNAIPALDRWRENHGLELDKGAAIHAEPVFTSFPKVFDDHGLQRQNDIIRVRTPVESLSKSKSKPKWAPRDGTPFLYMTFGTHAAEIEDAKSIFHTALKAVADLPVSAIMTVGRDFDIDDLNPIPDNVTVKNWVPQNDIFAHATAILCHGGSGTVLGGLAAGLPQVVVPIFADQPSNADRMVNLGAGIRVNEKTPEALRIALETVLTDPSYTRAAQKVAREMVQMTEPDAAVDAMLGHADSS